MTTIRMIALALTCVCLPAFAAEHDAPATDWSFVQKKLEKNGFKKKFITSMRKTYDPSEFVPVIELNCLLFLRKTDYHTPQISSKAVDDVRQFMIDHEKALDKAAKDFKVSRAVIASLIWMESRFGENQGRFHVASVFLNLIQAERPQAIAHLKLEAAPRFTPKLTTKIASDITAKAKTKAKWALKELKAVETMWERDQKLVKNLKGSFAGAFGMPQFIPSSYNSYAKTDRKKKAPDLTRAEDAIRSVAFYLKESGWKTAKKTTHQKALLKYNNSVDYAQAILKLADEAEIDSKRLPASRGKKRKHNTKRADVDIEDQLPRERAADDKATPSSSVSNEARLLALPFMI